jgi:hypothetical protein
MPVFKTDLISTDPVAVTATEIFALGESTGGTNLIRNLKTATATTSAFTGTGTPVTFGSDADGDFMQIAADGQRAITTNVARSTGSFSTLFVFKSNGVPSAGVKDAMKLRVGSNTIYESIKIDTSVLYSEHGNGGWGWAGGGTKLTGGALAAVCYVFDEALDTCVAYFSDGTSLSTAVTNPNQYGFPGGFVDFFGQWSRKDYLFARWNVALTPAQAQAKANAKGNDMRVAAVAAVPNAPIDLVFSAVTNNSITVQITPSATGSAGTGYKLQKRIVGAGSYDAAIVQAGDTFVVSGLAANTEYEFVGITTNSTGDSLNGPSETQGTLNPAIGGGGTLGPTAGISAVTGVVVTPAAITVAPNSSTPFTAIVQGLNSPSQTVAWSAPGGGSVSGSNFIAPALPGIAYKMRATSVQDGAYFADATIAVATNQTLALSPSTVKRLPAGTTATFTATLNGLPESGTYTITKGAGSISASGVFTAADIYGSVEIQFTSGSTGQKLTAQILEVTKDMDDISLESIANVDGIVTGQISFTGGASGRVKVTLLAGQDQPQEMIFGPGSVVPIYWNHGIKTQSVKVKVVGLPAV